MRPPNGRSAGQYCAFSHYPTLVHDSSVPLRQHTSPNGKTREEDELASAFFNSIMLLNDLADIYPEDLLGWGPIPAE